MIWPARFILVLVQHPAMIGHVVSASYVMHRLWQWIVGRLTLPFHGVSLRTVDFFMLKMFHRMVVPRRITLPIISLLVWMPRLHLNLMNSDGKTQHFSVRN